MEVRESIISTKMEIDEERHNPLNSLPVELACEIFSKLDLASLANNCLVNKQWNALASDQSIWKAVLANSCGVKRWFELLGAEVGEEPPLPREILEILKSPCPFSNNKKVFETHCLVLIPETINGKPLNINTLGELIKEKFPELSKDESGYRYIWKEIQKCAYNNDKSHWILMTKDVLERSRSKKFSAQEELVKDKGQGIYQVPCALDAAIVSFMEYARSGKRLFGHKPLTYTRCQENIQDYQLVVGGFAPAGLVVHECDFDDGHIGVAALRKFFFRP